MLLIIKNVKIILGGIMIDKIVESLKNTYTVPSILIKEYKKLKLDEKELVILIYLLNQKDIEFNPLKISNELNINMNDLLTIINELTKKDLLKIDHIVDKNIHKETINLSSLYNKLAFNMIGEKQEKDNSIYDKFEKEFGRTLSPMEYEIIGAWLNNYSEDIVIEALKEAIYNNVNNLRYIDKILSEWNKKGIKNIDDIEEDRKNFKKKDKKELIDYDWLNENE